MNSYFGLQEWIMLCAFRLFTLDNIVQPVLPNPASVLTNVTTHQSPLTVQFVLMKPIRGINLFLFMSHSYRNNFTGYVRDRKRKL